MHNESIRRLVQSALMFRAMQEIAEEEIRFLQNSPINKQQVKKRLEEVRRILDKEIGLDNDKYNVVDFTELKLLRTEEYDLDRIDPQPERLTQIKARIKEIVDTDNEASRSYYLVYNLMEKILKRMPTLDLDKIIDLNEVLDSYFSGDIKFVDDTELKN